MKINFLETKKNIWATGRTLRGFARLNGFNPYSFEQFLKGDWKGTDTTDAYVAAMRRDGLLVEEPDDDQQAA